jgi:hypothetical protein
MISRWVVGVVLLFGILLFMLPKTDEQSLARIAGGGWARQHDDCRQQAQAEDDIETGRGGRQGALELPR